MFGIYILRYGLIFFINFKWVNFSKNYTNTLGKKYCVDNLETNMKVIYNNYNDEDGFLYILYKLKIEIYNHSFLSSFFSPLVAYLMRLLELG